MSIVYLEGEEGNVRCAGCKKEITPDQPSTRIKNPDGEGEIEFHDGKDSCLSKWYTDRHNELQVAIALIDMRPFLPPTHFM